MLRTRLVGLMWLCFNIGFLKTFRIVFNIFSKNRVEYLVEFNFNNKKIKMFIESERTDLAMLTEIFCFEAYEIKKNIEPKLIIDGGSNKGSAAIYFGLKYPNAKIHCYEPNIKLISILKKNIEINKIKADIYNEALSDKEADLFFEISENHQYSKLSDKVTEIKVKAISLNKRYAGQKIDILKLDIEGEEEKVISSIEFNKLFVGIIIQEIHYSRVNFEKIRFILESNKYKIEPPYSQYRFLNSQEEYPILIAVNSN